MTGRLLDELAGLLLPVVMPLVRRLPALILVLAGLISLMGILTLVAAHRDDARIDEHRAVAVAQVLPGSDFHRTLVSFSTANGELVFPERGVFYPRGLRPGQNVRVEYDATDPELVRVAGRDASVGTWPIVLLIMVTWAIALPVGFTLRGRQLRQIEAMRLAAAEAAAVKAAVAAESAAVKAEESGGETAGATAPGERPEVPAHGTVPGHGVGERGSVPDHAVAPDREPVPGRRAAPEYPDYRAGYGYGAVPDHAAGPSRESA